MRKASSLLFLLLFAAMALLPLFMDHFRIDQFSRILVYIILVVSLDLLVGFTGLVSVGHAAFFGVAVYVAALLADRLDIGNALIALPASVILSALLALVVGLLTLRLRGVYYIMVTLAFTQIVFFILHDSTWTGGSDGILVLSDIRLAIGNWELIDLSNLYERYYFSWGLTVLVVFLLYRLVDSPFGRVLQGIRANERRMQAMGYPVHRYKLTAFVIAGAMSGLAGYLYFTLTSFADPTLTYWLHSAQLLIITALGGAGTLIGPAIGAVVFTLFVDWSSELTDHWKLFLGLIIVIVTLYGRDSVRWLRRNRPVAPAGAASGSASGNVR